LALNSIKECQGELIYILLKSHDIYRFKSNAKIVFKIKRRVRFGYAHVANNRYDKWQMYAIGGSAGSTIFSEGNYFIAPDISFAKEVCIFFSNKRNYYMDLLHCFCSLMHQPITDCKVHCFDKLKLF